MKLATQTGLKKGMALLPNVPKRNKDMAKKDPNVIGKNSKVLGMLGDHLPPKYDGSLDSMVGLIQEPSEKPTDTRKRVVELLKGEDDMRKFVETFEIQSRRASATSFDRICELSGTNRSDCFGAIARVLHRYSFDITRTVIATVAARQAGRVAMMMANNAARPDGIADRRLFMEVTRQTDKTGGGFTVNVPVTNTAIAQAKADSEGVNPGGRELPQFEEGIKQLGASLRVLDVSKAG
jgi:hypothetical protein